MMVEVCGVKYVEGISKKSGKPYRAYIIHHTQEGASKGFQGFVVGDAYVEVKLLNGRTIQVGDKLELFYNKDGFLEAVNFCV